MLTKLNDDDIMYKLSSAADNWTLKIKQRIKEPAILLNRIYSI